MIHPNLSPALARLSFCWIFLPVTLLASAVPAEKCLLGSAVPAEKWDEALGRLKQNGGCTWESDPPETAGDAPALHWKKKRPTSKGKKRGDWAATLKDFKEAVEDVLRSTDLNIRTLGDPEYLDTASSRSVR
jgi:hypothetical protein